MSTPDLKKRLIEKINITQDPAILEEAYRLLESETADLELYKLSEEQKAAVRVAQEQIKRGEYLTNEQANRGIDQWLKK